MQQETVMQTPNMDDYLIQKKIEVMIEISNKKIIAEMNAKIAKLTEEISELRRKSGESRPVFVKQEPAQQAEAPEPQREAPRSAASNSTTVARPRYGDYKSQDVSVEKFFNFGSKR